jgi:hypothetical protein
VLLHAAVQPALDAATAGVGGEDEPLPRRAQLGEFGVQVLAPFVLVGCQLIGLPSWSQRKFSVIAPSASSRPSLRLRRRAVPRDIHLLAP